MGRTIQDVSNINDSEKYNPSFLDLLAELISRDVYDLLPAGEMIGWVMLLTASSE